MLDIDTAIGDGAQLGHASAAARGQRCRPASAGTASPAAAHQRRLSGVVAPAPLRQPAPVRLRRAAAAGGPRAAPRCSPLVAILASRLDLVAPSVHGLAADGSALATRRSTAGSRPLTGARCSCSGSLAALAVMLGVPRVLDLLVRPGRVYPLYGVRYWIAAQVITRLTNRGFYMRCSATAPPSCTTCRRSATGCRGSSRPGRTSALSSSTTTPVPDLDRHRNDGLRRAVRR